MDDGTGRHGIDSPHDPSESRRHRLSVVIPVRDAMEFLPECLPTVLEATDRYGDAEVILVDNGSVDGSLAHLRSIPADRVTLLEAPGASVAGVRNRGAGAATGTYLSFVDADCKLVADYYRHAVGVLADPTVAATGSRHRLPAEATWLERTWHALHDRPADGFVHYLPSGNLFVRADVFREVGGFDESLATGEDSELCRRILDAGYAIYECHAVGAVHLGNPKTLGEFVRKEVWHGLGMFGGIRRGRLNRPTAMLLVFVLCALVGGALGIREILRGGWTTGVLVACAAVLAVPVVTVAYRFGQVGRVARPLRAVLLYSLYYVGRLGSLWWLLRGKAHDFRG